MAKAKAKKVTKKKVATKAKKSAASTKSKAGISGAAASKLIDARIKELGDWRGKTLAQVRTLILKTNKDVVEEVKWGDVPVWSNGGIICTGETYKSVVKLTFPKGASLADPAKIFNSSLEGTARRAIDFREGEKINDKALKDLVAAAIALNNEE